MGMEIAQAAFMEKQAELEALAQSFEGLANGLLSDFGCDEICIENCFMAGPSSDPPMCVVSNCCSSVQAITVGVTQTNIQCQFNEAKNVQCFNADL
jgi:hypothetical protein